MKLPVYDLAIRGRFRIPAILRFLLQIRIGQSDNLYCRYQPKDQARPVQYTNKFTVADLFPDENPVSALKRELRTLTVEEYIQTVQDLHFPNRSEMREFGKVYAGKGDVYIKIRVELLSAYGGHTAFIMSFHYI